MKRFLAMLLFVLHYTMITIMDNTLQTGLLPFLLKRTTSVMGFFAERKSKLLPPTGWEDRHIVQLCLRYGHNLVKNLS